MAKDCVILKDIEIHHNCEKVRFIEHYIRLWMTKRKTKKNAGSPLSLHTTAVIHHTQTNIVCNVTQ
jgi:hypothetical protein